MRKTWDDQFVGKVGGGEWGVGARGMGDFKKWAEPSNGGMILKWWG